MIILTTPVYSDLDPVMIAETGKHNLGDTIRRVARIATLDGGNVFADGGSSPSDATMTIDLSRISADEFERLRIMTSGYTTLHAATSRGHFLVAPVSLNGKTLTLYLKEELSP